MINPGAVARQGFGLSPIYIATQGFFPAAFDFGGPETPNVGGFIRFDRGYYKYKYKVKDRALKVIESLAAKKVEPKQLKPAIERAGIEFIDVYREIFLDILQEMQDQESEQIAHILAALL
jgi:hypothetical protein